MDQLLLFISQKWIHLPIFLGEMDQFRSFFSLFSHDQDDYPSRLLRLLRLVQTRLPYDRDC